MRIARTAFWLFRPKFTAGSLVHVRDENGLVLLVCQRFARVWGLPGGFQTGRERADDAARRELAEETGIRVDGDLQLALRYQQEGRRHFDSVFLATLRQAQPKVGPVGRMARLEIVEAKWFDLSDKSSVPANLRWETSVAFALLAERDEGSND